MKWDPLKAQENTQHLLDLSEKISQSAQPDLIVWPATAYPRLISATQRQLPFLSQTPLIVGAVVREGPYNRNSALLVLKDQIVQRFDKSHLVPFGEFVPFKQYLPFEKLVANVGDFIPGETNQDLLKLSIKGQDFLLGGLICYEDIFSRSSVRLARQGAHAMVNLTNDAWYLKSSAQAQHASMSYFQVLQTFLPMIRATNNGLSSFMTPQSREDLENFVSLAEARDVPIVSSPRKTFFVCTYPLMEWIWPILFAIAFGWKRNPRTRRIFFRS